MKLGERLILEVLVTMKLKLSSSRVLFKMLKTKISKTLILPILLISCVDFCRA